MSATPLEAIHWAYVFAVFAHFYGFGPEAVLRLTPRQTQGYLSMIRYVSEWSPDAGAVPPLPSNRIDAAQLKREAARVGLRLPSSERGRTDGG